MVPDVIIATPYDTVGELREIMLDEGVHAVPIVDAEDMPVGIVTSSDLLIEVSPEASACEVMTPLPIFTVSESTDIHVAADIMRTHNLHHVVVTHEKKIVGILSSFDFLLLFEERHFVMKKMPTEPKRQGGT